MPAKIKMFLSNGTSPSPISTGMNKNIPQIPKASTALNAPIIARIHNAKPGCSSCGR